MLRVTQAKRISPDEVEVVAHGGADNGAAQVWSVRFLPPGKIVNALVMTAAPAYEAEASAIVLGNAIPFEVVEAACNAINEDHLGDQPMLVDPRHLPTSIATRRAHLGLTQAELADSLSVSRQFLALMESGERTPSVAMLCKLCEALGCAPADLLTGGE